MDRSLLGICGAPRAHDFMRRRLWFVPALVAGAVLLGSSAFAQSEDSEATLIAETAGVSEAPASDAAPPPREVQDNRPPPVEHTGLETLVKDIVSDLKAFPQ